MNNQPVQGKYFSSKLNLVSVGSRRNTLKRNNKSQKHSTNKSQKHSTNKSSKSRKHLKPHLSTFETFPTNPTLKPHSRTAGVLDRAGWMWITSSLPVEEEPERK
jgi:hypothetical protein